MKKKIAKIKYTKFEDSYNNKPRSLKFICFLLLKDIFSYFK